MQLSSDQLQMFDVKTYQKTLQSFLEDFRVKHSQLLVNEKDLMTHEELCFLKLHGFYDISRTLGNQSHTFYSKMLKAYLTTKMDKHLLLSTEFLPSLVIPLNAKLLILAGFSPKIESGYSLSDILETEVDQKYFLSNKAMEYLERAEERRGTEVAHIVQQ